MVDNAASELVEALSRCRCCLQRAPDRALDKPYTRHGRTEIYLHMLNQCFNINLNADSEECGICEGCVGRLQDASDFKLQVQRSQAKLRERLERALQSLKDDNSEDSDAKSERAGGDPIKDDLSDENADFMSTEDDWQRGNLTASWHADLSAGARRQLAMTCRVRLERLLPETEHIVNNVTVSQNEDLDFTKHVLMNPEETSINYNICNEQFLERNIPNHHIGAYNKLKPYACDICKKKFTLQSTLKRHIHTAQALQCDICNKLFTFKNTLVRHIRAHMQKRYTCNICGEKFTLPSSLQRHGLLHTEQTHSCEICNITFSEKTYLTRHWRTTHVREKPFHCDICKKQYSNKKTLRDHMYYTHTRQRLHTCDICNKKFKHQWQLAEHIKRHAGNKSFHCYVCTKKFVTKSDLQTHIKIHKSLKPYKCTICDKLFSLNSNLKQHTYLHTGQKPYVCEVCNKPFAVKAALKQHAVVHTGEQPYSCAICNKSFSLKGNLDRHIKLLKHIP